MDGWPAAKDLHVSCSGEDLHIGKMSRTNNTEQTSFMVAPYGGDVLRVGCGW
jgi:hypothetical protein